MDLFEGMIQKDQDEFRKIMNRLMSTGFILRRKEQTKSDYYFILRHRSVFERYLDVLSYQIDINEEYGVIQLLNRENYNHLQLTMHESIILLILRILFDEKKRELSLTDVVVNMGDIQEKYLSMQIRSEQIGKTVMGNALKKFRRYSIVELLDGNNIREESRVLIYDSIMMAVRVDDIKRVSELLERYRKDGQITEGEDNNTGEGDDTEIYEADAELVGDGRTDEEAAGLGADDLGDALVGEMRGDVVDERRERLRVLEQRRDVLEDDARLGIIGDVDDLALEIVIGHGASFHRSLQVPIRSMACCARAA